MLTENKARRLATDWVAAWNAHDLDQIMSHYSPEVVLVSPVAAKLLKDPAGTVKGKEALREYFKLGLETYPALKFTLLDIMWGITSIVLYYTNHQGSKTGEFMELDVDQKIIKVVANYNG